MRCLQAWNGAAGDSQRSRLEEALKAGEEPRGTLGYNPTSGRCQLALTNPPLDQPVAFALARGAGSYTQGRPTTSFTGYSRRVVYASAAGKLGTKVPPKRTPAQLAASLFHTPSGNIGCDYMPAQFGQPATLRCDIGSGLVPKPTSTPAHHCTPLGGAWIAMIVTDHGPARPACVNDAFGPGRAIAYGQTWKRQGFACASAITGLRCSAPSGYGFFVSRQHSYTFPP